LLYYIEKKNQRNIVLSVVFIMLVDKIFKFLKKEFFQREEGKIKTVAREFFFFFFF